MLEFTSTEEFYGWGPRAYLLPAEAIPKSMSTPYDLVSQVVLLDGRDFVVTATEWAGRWTRTQPVGLVGYWLDELAGDAVLSAILRTVGRVVDPYSTDGAQALNTIAILCKVGLGQVGKTVGGGPRQPC